MKKTGLLVNSAILILLILVISFCLWQLRENVSLRQELDKKGQELKDVESNSRHLEALKKQNQDLSYKEEAIKRKVPVNEKQPISLIKTLTVIAGETGLRKAVFSIKEMASQGGSASARSLGQPPGQTLASPTTQGSTGLPMGIKPIEIGVSSEATYLQALSFLERLMNLERVIVVDELTIERKKEILPYQQVSLQISTYSFLKDNK